MKALLSLLILADSLCLVSADGPADNLADKVRAVPPLGIIVTAETKANLNTALEQLGTEINSLRAELKDKPQLRSLLPDVEVYHKAVRYAVQHNEFFKTNELDAARRLLAQGSERVKELRAGRPSWHSATGLVVRGYLSRLDDSVQPYGLVVPASYRPESSHRYRLDFWFHGRGETLSELSFIDGRQKSPGEFTPPETFVVHLYGRYCNGQRFAGEVDLFETLADVRRHYPIDEDRLVVRGFSLGGAACWHFAVHHAGMWAAAAPGAGFSETADFLKVFQGEKLQPTWYEQKLWHLYDATDYARNLIHCPTVAYSGADDRQKQAADFMATAMTKEGIELAHIIGPKTGHQYHPEAKTEINRRLDSIVARGREPAPWKVQFTTWTLRYNQMRWVTIDALEQHWERAEITAELQHEGGVAIQTTNINAFTLSMPAGTYPLDITRAPQVVIDGTKLTAPKAWSDRSWKTSFRKENRKWVLADNASSANTLHKKHGLQGPIDDAFMDRFLFVRPTGQPLNATVGAWVSAELARATNEWRRQFRGEARVKDDVDVTPADMRESNLILWGDPTSNRLIGELASKLPVRWDDKGVHTADAIFPAANYVPILIYPNPSQPDRYVVFNSGFTFREYDYLNNARQTPKLPDYAIIDISVPPTSRAPGKIAQAGFFGERWELIPRSGDAASPVREIK